AGSRVAPGHAPADRTERGHGGCRRGRVTRPWQQPQEDAMNDEQMMATRALGWLVRLPLSGDPEVAGLLGIDEHDARRTVHDLALRGWADSVEPGSPELERRRRYFVAEDAIAAWCAAREVTVATLTESVPVGRNDLLRRIARIEI